jgi:copper chaperone
MQTEVINVKGMTCMGCVSKVKTGLENIAGVSGAAVSLEQKQATVQYDETKTQPEQIKDAIKNAGYEVIAY